MRFGVLPARLTLRARLTLLFTIIALVAGAAGGLLLARRLQLGLESDLDGVTRQRAAAVAASAATGPVDLTAAQGPVQVLSAQGQVQDSAGGASLRAPLMDAAHLRRVDGRYLIIDSHATLAGERESVRVLARPAAGGRFVLVAVNRDPGQDIAARTLVELSLLGVPATALLALGVWLVTGAALRPVEDMRRQAAAATPDSPAVLSIPRGGAELSRLAATLNDLLADQQSALRAEQSFLADAGHELRTPLAILAGELELADRPARTEAELRATVSVAREETARLVRLAEQLLILARVDGLGLRRTTADLREVAGRAVAAWTATASSHGIALRLAGAQEVRALVDPDRIRQVIDNLLSNALRVAPAGTAVAVTVSREASWVQVSVRDNGPGFAPGFLPHAFERFRRADPARTRTPQASAGGAVDGGGTGLGLAVVERIAAAHGGHAFAEDCPGGGALVGVRLPREEAGVHTVPTRSAT